MNGFRIVVLQCIGNEWSTTYGPAMQLVNCGSRSVSSSGIVNNAAHKGPAMMGVRAGLASTRNLELLRDAMYRPLLSIAG